MGFVVQVAQAQSGQKWRIGGTAHIQGLEIASIQPGGVIETWNQNCAAKAPREMLRRGDVIVNANGKDDLLDMLSSLKCSKSVRLCVVRLNDSRCLFESD